MSGTFATAAGPHSGGGTTHISRFGTLNSSVYVHAAFVGAFAVLFVFTLGYLMAQRRSAPRLFVLGGVVGVVLLVQMGLGDLQYRSDASGRPMPTPQVHPQQYTQPVQQMQQPAWQAAGHRTMGQAPTPYGAPSLPMPATAPVRRGDERAWWADGGLSTGSGAGVASFRSPPERALT